jgi:ribosomal protein S13
MRIPVLVFLQIESREDKRRSCDNRRFSGIRHACHHAERGQDGQE